MISLLNTVLAQYANSPVLMAWLNYLNAEIDTSLTMYAPAVQATANFSGNLMFVTSVTNATGSNQQGYFCVGQSLSGSSLPAGLTIAAVLAGDGLVGTYQLSTWCPTVNGVAVVGSQFGTQASMSVLNAFYYQMWNVYTAVGYGLDVWGRKVGVTRYVSVPSTGATWFGFSNAALTASTGTCFTFGSPMYPSTQLPNTIVALPDNTFRQLILAKARGNIYYNAAPLGTWSGGYVGGCSAQALNQTLTNLLSPRVPGSLGLTESYVQDNGNMTMTIVFNTALTGTNYAMMIQSGVLPHPAGVGIYIVNGATQEQLDFGFSGTGQEPFGFGPFYQGLAQSVNLLNAFFPTTDMGFYGTNLEPFAFGVFNAGIKAPTPTL